jgi:hypothetical protein
LRTAVDTNILFDLLAGPTSASSQAKRALADALALGPLAVCPVVYTELATGFTEPGEVKAFIRDLGIEVDQFGEPAMLAAAEAWGLYTQHRGHESQCSHCGHRTLFTCPRCGETVSWRQHIIADFLIGAHALYQADCLLTRDVAQYRRYFPSLQLLR